MKSAPALSLLRLVSSFLRENRIAGPEKEAEIILVEGLGIDRVRLYRDSPGLSEAELRRLDEILERRAKREPLQYILGHVEFYGLKINVGPGVLIPRPETELLVEEALRIFGIFGRKLSEESFPRAPFKDFSKSSWRESEGTFFQEGSLDKTVRILDLCTGSGAIALAVAKNLPGADVFGTDIEERAIGYARRNALENGVGNATFLEGSLFEPVREMTFDMVLSNPPYIKSQLIDGLEPEVRDWEPGGALDGGPDGLYFLRKIISGAPGFLRPGGRLIVEMGEGQAEEIARISGYSGLKPVKIIRDYAGVGRVMVSMVASGGETP